MDVLFENPLARMYGPYFLVLYAVLYLLTLLFVWIKAPGISSEPGNLVDYKLPEQPDPYELAYIKQGEKGLILLALYSLIDRKYILLLSSKTKSSLRIRRKDESANFGFLNEYEKSVYTSLTEEMQMSQFIERQQTKTAMKTACAQLNQKLIDQRLMWSDSEDKKFEKIKQVCIVTLAGLGLYKLIAASIHGHSNVAGLFLIAIVGSILINKIKTDKRPTTRGHAVLNKAKQAFSSVSGDQFLNQGLYMQQLLLSLYGFELLKDSSKAYLHTYLKERLEKASTMYFANSSSSGSGSCSSSGCGGSCGGGCGGGCGGCS